MCRQRLPLDGSGRPDTAEARNTPHLGGQGEGREAGGGKRRGEERRGEEGRGGRGKEHCQIQWRLTC